MTSKSKVIGALVLVNVFWAGNPVMQKFLLADFAPLQVAWLRMVVGALVLAAVWPWVRRIGNWELGITNGNAAEGAVGNKNHPPSRNLLLNPGAGSVPPPSREDLEGRRLRVDEGVVLAVGEGVNKGEGSGLEADYEHEHGDKREARDGGEYGREHGYEKGASKERTGVARGESSHRGLWWRAMAMGAVVFFVTPLLVTYGLDASLAVHNSFITGLEPVITIVLARMFLGERMRAAGWMILAVALAGFALLSGVGGNWRELLQTTYFAGNLLLLFGMAGEAMYSILGAPLAKRMAPVTVFLIALTTGAGLLSVFLVASGTLPDFSHFTAHSVIGLLWTGPVTTTFCYLVWLTSLRHVPVNAAAFTLFVQPLLGAVMGYALLGERLVGLQVAGAALILVSLVMYVRRMR